MLAAGMERIATRGLSERVHEQAAGVGIARDDDALPRLEVLARLLLGPCRRPFRERHQSRLSVGVARDAARVSRSLCEEDRLHAIAEEREIERRLRGGRRRALRGLSSLRSLCALSRTCCLLLRQERNDEKYEYWHRSRPLSHRVI